MVGSGFTQFDPVVGLTDTLCQIPSFLYQSKNALTTRAEEELAEFVSRYLATNAPWLTVTEEPVVGSRYNLFVHDGSEDIDLLIVGHLDTVPPSPGWTIPEFSVQDNRYYGLGASDVKGALAAVLDAIKTAGPTTGVAYLFYVDGMEQTAGMNSFLTTHTSINPRSIFSICGSMELPLYSCRGCIEIELTISGHGAHSSLPSRGTSAYEAMCHVTQNLKHWCEQQQTPATTTCNISCAKSGSLKPNHKTRTGQPAIYVSPNRVPDVAWIVMDIRPGDPSITPETIKDVVDNALANWNEGRAFPASMDKWHVRFYSKGFHSDEHATHPATTTFTNIHKGETADPSTYGYFDIAVLASSLPDSTTMCLSPKSGNKHAPDEWVDIPGLIAYRDSLRDLLSGYRASS